MARLEVLCQHRHVAHQLHLARCALLHAVRGALPEFPAVGAARQRLPRLSARKGHVAEATRETPNAVLHPSDGPTGSRVPPDHHRHRPCRLRLRLYLRTPADVCQIPGWYARDGRRHALQGTHHPGIWQHARGGDDPHRPSEGARCQDHLRHRPGRDERRRQARAHEEGVWSEGHPPEERYGLSLLHRQPLARGYSRPSAAGRQFQGCLLVQSPERGGHACQHLWRQHRPLPPQRRVNDPADL